MKSEIQNKINLTDSICFVGDDTILNNKLKKYFENTFKSVKFMD
jgi:hypothetical protein